MPGVDPVRHQHRRSWTRAAAWLAMTLPPTSVPWTHGRKRVAEGRWATPGTAEAMLSLGWRVRIASQDRTRWIRAVT